MEYNDKLRLAKEALESGSYDRETIEYIFPELKESESIRLWLINLLSTMQYHHCDEDMKMGNKAIAWLEKQGEQKPILPIWKYKNDSTPLLRDSLILNKYGCVAKSPSGAIVSDVWVIDYDELAKLPKEEYEKQGKQKPVKTAIEVWKEMRLEVYAQASGNRHEPNYSDDNSKIFSLNDIDEIFEKISGCYVEQKPVELSHDDEIMIRQLTDYFTTGKGLQNTNESVVEWLNDVREKFSHVEQNPAWSEEDENILATIIEEGDLKPSERAWLKSLKDKVQPQPKQYLSEDDEGIIVTALSNTYSDDITTKLLNKINSLRPQKQWKPSDEQMDALHYVTNFDYGGHKATLVSLYEQLKKLKG